MSYKDEYLIERNEKNKAYYFIIKHGLLERFAEFCRDYKAADPFEDCIEYLSNK